MGLSNLRTGQNTKGELEAIGSSLVILAVFDETLTHWTTNVTVVE
jgi:hypothetical protein